MYEHEPFDTFQHKVANLCQELRKDVASDCFEVTRLKGGSYNRVISITFNMKRKDCPRWPAWAAKWHSFVSRLPGENTNHPLQPGQYILRIPWADCAAFLEHEVAIIDFLNAHTFLPVCRIAQFH